MQLLIVHTYRKTGESISKLEQIYESNTLMEKDTFDEGADLSTQGPVLHKLQGSILQRRISFKVRITLPSFLDLLQLVYWS